jgi:arylsulfatase
MVYTFDDASAPSRRTAQYFELAGNRAIYEDGWIASTTPLRLPWVTAGGDANPDEFKWELYDLRHDFSQADDLAASNPAKLKGLQQVFDREARRHHVYPLDASFAERANPAIRPSVTRGRSSFTYYPGMVRIPEASTPDVKNRSYEVSADVEIPAGGASGILATQGGRFGGWGLMLLDGKPTFVYALSNQSQHKYKVASGEPLAPGRHAIRFEFSYDGGGLGKGGMGRLFVDGTQVAKGRIPQTVRFRFSLDETFDVGRDTGTPVIEDYALPFAFGGTLQNVNITLR